MSASSEFEPAARQDYGPTTSSEHVLLEHKLAENMNVPSIRTPVLRAVPLSSPADGDPEPDSTNPENIAHSSLDKEVEYHISEKQPDAEMSIDTLSGIVRIEEATIDDVGRITYPIIQEADDSSDANYQDSATLIQAPLSTAIVQNVTKLPQNFTINVDATVSNITAIQNVSQDVSGGSQTLWLPTLLATSATADNKLDDDRSQAGLSQIIITSDSYVTNDISQAGPRHANIVTETSYINSRSKASKVQILSNVSLPKTGHYSQQYVTQSGKEVVANVATPVFGTQNHVYKLSANVLSQKSYNNSVLTNKTPKSQSLIGAATSISSSINNSSGKNTAYNHTFTKGTNLNKTLNKVNNGANLNAVVAASTGNTSCHILSRVVSGPNKLSVHSGRKSVNTMKGSKNSSALSGTQKQSRAIKIIQQTGSTHKSESKNWPVANMTTYKSQQPTYGTVDSNSKIIQKVGSPTHKAQPPMSLHKVASKGERLILQSPCGPVLISTAPISTSLHKGPHYVQSGLTPNLRYVHTYSPETGANVSQVSANQQLTAQILQSLSQPKLLMPPAPSVINHTLAPHSALEDYATHVKAANQRRIVFGDPSTLLTADDIIGMEERPNLVEELRRYAFQGVALVMLDHTYALPAQKLPPPSPPAPAPALAPVAPPSPARPAHPAHPAPRPAYEMQHMPALAVPPTLIGTPIPVSSLQLSALYKPPGPGPVLTPGPGLGPAPIDEDAASLSSLEEPTPDRGGSDTETAPEVEEEGKTRCVCEFTHDDGYMICCDRCGEWQHVDCMGIDRGNIPDAYMCELCMPRVIDRRHARAIQLRKREELHALGASDSDSGPERGPSAPRRRRLLTVTTYTDTSGTPNAPPHPPPALPAQPVPPAQPAPPPAQVLPKRGPAKRPKKTEVVRKGKRKLTEKRVKRKKEMMMNRSKYSGMASQAHWQESYESAVTNHYSPELRAKIAKYGNKTSGTGAGAEAAWAGGPARDLCATVPHAGGKILIATRDLRAGAAVVELRGKYMLSAQHRTAAPPASHHPHHPHHAHHAHAPRGQKPGPFVFFYRLPRDDTQICIDTRTYGNEARFVRRSCKPNAELQHCIVKGALHVYLVTIAAVQSNTEITVGHDAAAGKQPCACGNPKHCKVNGLNSLVRKRESVEYPTREKRSRNRCTSVSSPLSPPPGAPGPPGPPGPPGLPGLPSLPFTPVKENPPPLIKSEKKSPIKQEPMSPVQPVPCIPVLNFDKPIKTECDFSEDKPEIDLIAKEEMREDIDEPDSIIKTETEVQEPPKEEIKKEEEEPSVEPPEPETEIIEPTVTKIDKIKTDIFSDEETKDTHPLKNFVFKNLTPKEESKVEDERPMTRELAARSACHDRSSRSSRANCITNQDSLDDKTDDSQDKLPSNPKQKDKDKKMTREERKMEAIMKAFERMEKAQQRKQEVKERQKRRESDPHPNAPDKEDDEDTQGSTKRRRKRKGRARTTSQSNRCRLNSADSDMVTSGDEAPIITSPRTPCRRISAPNHSSEANNDSINEDLGLSSACLLVEAAVGSVESAFKLPKTKKTMANEWVGRSPERTPSPYHSPYRSNTLHSATSLESLVRVASTMIGDLSGGHSEVEEFTSPPRTPGRDRSRPPKKSKRITRSTPPTEVVEVQPLALPQHSAKKRWLRQAISEESDSPSAESPPNEMVTPLKKRRLARESLSCEPQNVPCTEDTSPQQTLEDSPVKEERHNHNDAQSAARNIMESLYRRDRTRSDSGQGSDDQAHMEHDILINMTGPHDCEDIRRIIGVPEEPKEDVKTNNNNIETPVCEGYKVVPMEIDTTITPQPQIKEEIAEVKGTESPQEKSSQSQSADTSGNSSPQRDEMDDIQKKIHSFHTENILILKSRNKKPPKEKRKKVNLNFDLNMVDDQISIQLRTENEPEQINGDAHEDLRSKDGKIQYVETENIPLPPVETIPLPATEHIPLPDEPIPPPEALPLPDDLPKIVRSPSTISVDLPLSDAASPLPTIEEPTKSTSSEKPEAMSDVPVETTPFTSRFNSTGLFSGIFNNMNQTFNMETQINDNVPNLQIIKSAIDRTTTLESRIFDKDSIRPGDELKSVQEILTRVNNMDSNNSVLLSGVLKGSDQTSKSLLTPSPVKGGKLYCPRSNDPRLNPPPVDKPKPVRRKLSITEYRKRHKGPASTDADNPNSSSNEPTPNVGEWSSESSSLSPLRLEAAAAAAADDLEQRLHRALSTTTQCPKVFDAQPTASERQRENLSSRLRREFGLALPDDEESRPPTDPDGAEAPRCER